MIVHGSVLLPKLFLPATLQSLAMQLLEVVTSIA